MTPEARRSGGGALPTGWELGEAEAWVAARLARWGEQDAAGAVWRKEPGFWPAAPPEEVPARLGWLTLPQGMGAQLDRILSLAKEVRGSPIERVLVLGMGGSSLAPGVFARTWGVTPGFPRLEILDSTHPDAVLAAARSASLERTLFIVSSKSGTTLEPNSFFAYFWHRLGDRATQRGSQFVAITDPGTPLEQLATAHGFRACFSAPPDVGGRYSALTEFGLVPAALAGVDIRRLLQRAREMAEGCSPAVGAARNPGLQLAAALGELAVHGRNKVTFVASPALGAFPAWAEQLIAESTGKQGQGIVPIAGEVAPFERTHAADRVIVELKLRSEGGGELEGGAAKAREAGIPVLRFQLEDLDELGAEFFRWELAVAAAGPILGIDPFDQPDVELAKELARKALSGPAGGASAEVPLVRVDGSWAFTSGLTRWMDSANVGDYLAVQAFLAPAEATDRLLHELREALRRRLRVSSTLGYGPRFLHSTGQLHKGGPATGLFLQLVDEPAEPVPLPEGHSSFREIIAAQAAGDAMALQQRERRILRIQLGADPAASLRSLSAFVRG
ncbi:MAG: hypothetical protein L3K04_07620 [Thermoplasmata archaeon]|nr:hypothetical protein [Thermoplasmata archaeon]